MRVPQVILVCAVLAAPGYAEETVSVPGTTVSMKAPEGFSLSSSFSGFENPQDGSSIMITELPAEAYPSLLELFSDSESARANFSRQGIKIDEAASLTVADREIPLLIGTQAGPGIEVMKYVTLFQGEMTVLLTFNVVDSEATTRSGVEASIRTVSLTSAPTIESKLEQLPFSFETNEPFRIGDAMGGSAVSLPTFEGTDPTGMKPVAFILRAVSVVDPNSDPAAVARLLMMQSPEFASAEITTSDSIRFAGGEGHYLEASAGDRTFMQYLRIPPDGMAIRLIAYGATTELEKLKPAVSQMAESVSIRE